MHPGHDPDGRRLSGASTMRCRVQHNCEGSAGRRLIPRTSPSQFLGCTRCRGGKCRRTLARDSSGVSCSQIRTTVQPPSSSRSVVSRSRAMFVLSFVSHHPALFTGHVACSGQPCQKQPSTNTASLTLVNRMSALRRGIPGSGASTRYRYPRQCSRRLSAISAAVSRVRCPAIRRDVAASVEGDAALLAPSDLSDGTSPSSRVSRFSVSETGPTIPRIQSVHGDGSCTCGVG